MATRCRITATTRQCSEKVISRLWSFNVTIISFLTVSKMNPLFTQLYFCRNCMGRRLSFALFTNRIVCILLLVGNTPVMKSTISSNTIIKIYSNTKKQSFWHSNSWENMHDLSTISVWTSWRIKTNHLNCPCNMYGWSEVKKSINTTVAYSYRNSFYSNTVS